MRGITTPVSVQLHSERMKCDPLAVYEAAAKVVGADKTFILESLSGPSRDRKATIIGIEPLLAVKIYERRATLEGDEPLINYLRNALSENGIVVDAAGCIAIDSSDSTWDLLRALQAPFDVPRQTHPSLAFFGYLSYDCVRFVEDIPDLTERTNDYPIIALTVFQTLMYFHANATVDVMVNNSALWASRSTDDYVALLADAAGIPADDTPISYPSVTVARDTVQKEQFLGWVDKALEHIRQGDIYQIQLGHEVQVDTPVKPFDVYRALRKNNPSPYMYLANLGGS